MSQAGIVSSSSSPPPPQVPITFTEDSGSAQAAANILNVLGLDTTANSDNGISTLGSGNTVTILLTNRQTGTVTTADATPTNVLSFALGATPGVYFFEGNVIAFNTTDTAGAGYAFSSAIRTTGAAGVEIATQFEDLFEEAAMSTADIDVTVSANNLVITVTGVAAKTINWNGFLTYRFVS